MTIIFVLLNLIMIFSSNLIAYTFLQKSNFSQHLITAFLIYISQITFSLLFLGVVIKTLTIPFILILNGAVSLLVVFFLRKNIKHSIVEFYKNVSDFLGYLFKIKDYFLYLILMLFGLQVVLLLIKIYYLPPHVWDVFTYHLHPVVEWYHQEMIPAFIDSPVSRANMYTLGSHLINFWFLKLLPDNVWIECPQFIYGLILVLTSYSMMVMVNIKRNIALRYAILIYFIPSILLESRTCQDHLALTAIILMSALYFVNVFFKKKSSQIFFLSLSLGILMGAKQNSLKIIVVFFLALLIIKGVNISKIKEFLWKNKFRLLIGSAIVLVLGGYWFLRSDFLIRKYLRIIPKILFSRSFLVLFFLSLGFLFLKRYIWHAAKKYFKRKKLIIAIASAVIIFCLCLGSFFIIKNNIPPNFFSNYKRALFSGEALQANILKNKDAFTKNILSFPIRIKDTGSPYTPDFDKNSGFGVQFFAFGLISYMIMTLLFIFKGDYMKSILGFFFVFSVVLMIGYFLYYHSRFNYRLFIFFPVFGIIFWSFILSKLDVNKYILFCIDGFVLVMILFNMVVCNFEGNSKPCNWKTLFTMTNSVNRTSIQYSPLLKGKDWKFIDKYVEPDQAIAFYGGSDSMIFPYFDNRMKRRIYYLRSLPGFRLRKDDNGNKVLRFTRKLKKNLKKRHIHFIHINSQGCYKWERIYVDDADPHVLKISKNLYYLKW